MKLCNIYFAEWKIPKKSICEACNFTKSSTPPWVFFTFFKLYKWYQIAQNITSACDWNVLCWIMIIHTWLKHLCTMIKSFNLPAIFIIHPRFLKLAPLIPTIIRPHSFNQCKCSTWFKFVGSTLFLQNLWAICRFFRKWLLKQKEKIKLNFNFHTSLWFLKTFWGTTKKCENKNLT